MKQVSANGLPKYLLLVLWLLCGITLAFGQTVLQTRAHLKKILGNNIPEYAYQIIATFPHDVTHFTEGLELVGVELFESTGLYGHSILSKVNNKTHHLIQQIALPSSLFGEGITVMYNKIYQLTWKENTGFIYDRNQLALLKTFTYKGEGWGLTHDKHHLIMSNGSAKLFFINPETFKIERTLLVRANHIPVSSLNELEYILGKIYANVWPTSIIIVISPSTGKVEAWLDLRKLKPVTGNPYETIANGIAYNEKNQCLLVTGKNWPLLYELSVKKSSKPRTNKDN